MRAFLLASLAALALLAACGSEKDSTPETSAPRAEGSPVAGTTLDGEQLSLVDFRGRPVFVNVWSSW